MPRSFRFIPVQNQDTESKFTHKEKDANRNE